MAINPCCMPLQRAVKIMAVIDTILSILELGFAILVLILFIVLTEFSKSIGNDDTGLANTFIAIACVGTALAILSVVMSALLHFGVWKRRISLCRIWLIIKLILFCIYFGICILLMGWTNEPSYVTVILIIIILYRIYMMVCVYCFFQELKLDATRAGFQARLENGGVANQMHNYSDQQEEPKVV